jgi:amino acid efflux transporter
MSRTAEHVQAGRSVTTSAAPLSATRGTALYVGALLGPGLLLLPGLAARAAGPASLVAWLVLLGMSALIAAVFAALGRAHPSAGGVAGYATEALGVRAGAAVGWCFLAGVVGGAPVVCLIGATYVTDLTGGGTLVRCLVAAAILLVVLALTLCGARASTAAQLALVGLLVLMVVVAVAGSAPSARLANWTPFAPHGWPATGRAAALLMMSFVGWEAVAPLTGRLASPARQLPRIIGVAFAVTAVIYLALATVTIGVLGPGAGTDVPVADLLVRGIGRPGLGVAAVAAVVLTLGTTNAYLTGASTMFAELTKGPGEPSRQRGSWRFLAAAAVSGLIELALYSRGVVTTAQLITVPTTLFLAVYLGCMLAAIRLLAGRLRVAAALALGLVVIVLVFSGWALVIAGLVAGVATLTGRGRPRACAGPQSSGLCCPPAVRMDR